MIAQRYRLYIERTDPVRNLARFYALSIEPTLFGEICLVRRWGRIGAMGRSMTHPCATEKEAVSLFLDLLRRKRQRGYRTLSGVARLRRVVIGSENTSSGERGSS